MKVAVANPTPRPARVVVRVKNRVVASAEVRPGEVKSIDVEPG